MWKSISDKYEASEEGHIRNKKTKHVLREFKGRDGYLRTQFDGKSQTMIISMFHIFASVAPF